MTSRFLAWLKEKLGRKTTPDLWQFGLDVHEVMWARISRGISGQLSAEEARRMVMEKQSAGVRAHFAYLEWLFNGSPATANRAVFDIYNRAVVSNRNRLSPRRRRWWGG
jgi:hypothetical protein